MIMREITDAWAKGDAEIEEKHLIITEIFPIKREDLHIRREELLLSTG